MNLNFICIIALVKSLFNNVLMMASVLTTCRWTHGNIYWSNVDEKLMLEMVFLPIPEPTHELCWQQKQQKKKSKLDPNNAKEANNASNATS